MARLLGFNGFSFQELECCILDDFYKFLECRVFDIVNAEIGGTRYDIFCDDEGLFKEEQRVTAIYTNDDGKSVPYLVGNLIFANHDNTGETTSLSDKDIITIKGAIAGVIDYNGKLNGVIRIKL